MPKALLMGTLGGVLRVSIGLLKLYESGGKGRTMRLGYLISSLLVAVASGALAGAICDGDWRMAALAGYAGSDFLENMYKLKLRRGFSCER